MKLDEAKRILGQSQFMDKLGKRTIKWEVPSDLKEANRSFGTIIGIGKWNNCDEIFVCISQGKELIYIGKKLWLEMTRYLNKIK